MPTDSILPPVQSVARQRVYVASKFGQYERARQLMDDLAEAGHTITHDWTRTDQFGRDGHPLFESEQELSERARADFALADLRGVRTADLVVYLADELSAGAPVEVGSALALGVSVYVVDPAVYTVFWDHPMARIIPSENAARAILGAV